MGSNEVEEWRRGVVILQLTRLFPFSLLCCNSCGVIGWIMFIFLLRQGLEKLQASVENEQWTGYKSTPVQRQDHASWGEGNS